jgi:serine/threonine protein kinase
MASFSTTDTEPNEIITELLNKTESVEYLNSGTYGLGLKVSLIHSTTSSNSFFPAIFSSPTPTESYPIKTICLDNRTTVGALDNGDVKVLFVKLVPLMKSIKNIDELRNYIDKKLELYIESKGIIETGILRKIEEHQEGTDYTLIFEYDIRRYYSLNFSEITYIGVGWDIKYESKELESSFDENFMKECKTQVKIYKATANNLSPICPAIYSSIVLEQETGANNYGTMLEIFKSKQRNIPGNFFDQLKVALNVNNMRSLGVLIMPCYRFPPMIGGWDYFQRFQEAFSDIKMLSKYFRINFYTDSKYDDKYAKNVLLGYDKMRTDKIQGLFYMVQIVSHMITMYKNGVIHGDLHLGNCLINKSEVCCKMPFNESGQTIDENSPFIGKVYIIDFGTAVELPTHSSSGTEVLNATDLREMILNILTIKGSHSYSPLSHFVYDWFVSLFIVRSKMGGYIISDGTPLIIEENITKMVELINEFMKSKMDFEEEIIAVKSSDQNFMSIIEEIRSINSSEDRRSVLIGGRDKVPITDPSTIVGEVSIINPNKDSPPYISMEDPKKTQTQTEKSKMTPELVNEIFRYTSDELKEIGKGFIKSVEVGMQSVKDLKQTKDE